MKKREWLSMIVLAMVTVATVLIGIGQIYVTGIDGARLMRPETLALLGEAAILFCVFFLILRRTKTVLLRACLLVGVTSIFLWLHLAFLPILVSGLYVLLLVRVGSVLRRKADRENILSEHHAVTVMADFLLGCTAVILLFCVMSLLGIGSIAYTRIAVALLAAFFAMPVLAGFATRLYLAPKCFGLAGKKTAPVAYTTAILLSLLFTMLLLQAGRMNICIDYDSLHYGLRSEYVLNNGGGIYENLGSVNVVYTYSKGLEILLLPLSGLPSYGFFLGFQIWMTAAILAVSGKIAEMFVSRRYSLLCASILSTIPGIMNMAVTAKTDSITVLFQLILVCFVLLYLKKHRSCYLTLAFAAFALTMVMKPTALVFSTILLGTAALYMLAAKQLRFSMKESWWPLWIPSLLMWALVWLRTILLTGIPVTSVFSSIWNMLGFEVKYPFLFQSLPSNGGTLFSKSGLVHFIKRLYGVLLAPVGEDMAHVRIAWGSGFLLIFLVLFLLPLLAKMRKLREKEKQPLRCLVAMFITTGLASLAALYLLWQVDGNYFMLLYALFTILAIIVIGKCRNMALAHALVKLMVPVVLFNITVTAVSNWAGQLGLTPIQVLHAGYYDNRRANREQMAAFGADEAWEILAQDPRNRVLVFGEQPEMLTFPCNAQSYTDIEGSDGNVYISASPEALVSFFHYAQIDYIYVGCGYLTPGTDGWNNVVTMLENGYLTDLLYENGSVLGRFEPEPTPPEDPAGILDEFGLKYWHGMQW